jgi:arylsulfatase A-like enzyme
LSTLRYTRRALLKTISAGAAWSAWRGQWPSVKAASPKSKKPNILFLFTDDQRQDSIGALGNPYIQTANLDKLVESGFVFKNAYCMGGFSAAVCLPSRMMMLRGRCWFAVRELPSDAPNFPKSMNEAGYTSFHYGKTGNTDKEVQKCFTYSNYLNDQAVRTSGQPGKVLADGAIDFLRGHKKDKPFFMYLAFECLHDPRVAPKEYLDKYSLEEVPTPPNFKPFHPFDNGELVVRDEWLAPWPRTEATIRRHLRDYYAVITYMDEQIGRIIHTLKEVGEYDNTIVVFSSDQGIAIGSHGLMGKQNLYEHSMGVPLIFSGPGIPKGRSSEAFVYLFDVYPTVCELAGAKAPEGLDGKSLAPIIQGKTENVRNTIFLAYRDLQRAVRRGRWKLLVYPQINKIQLFDLQEDPHETKNLADDPSEAARIEDLPRGQHSELLAVMREQQKLFGDTQPLMSENPKPADISLEFFNNLPTRDQNKK